MTLTGIDKQNSGTLSGADRGLCRCFLGRDVLSLRVYMPLYQERNDIMSKDEKIKSTIHAKDIDISVLTSMDNADYISLTDIARYRNPEAPGYVI